MARIAHHISAFPIIWLCFLPISLGSLVAAVLNQNLGVRGMYAVPFGIIVAIQAQRLIRDRTDGKTQHQRRVELAEKLGMNKDSANRMFGGPTQAAKHMEKEAKKNKVSKVS